MTTARRRSRAKGGICGKYSDLNAEQARELLAWASLGTKLTHMAKRYGVSPAVVRAAVRGEHKKPYRSAE